ncbi:hypothetical protein Bp8pS_251 [Bacillus phage vB_BpuM-BpSp]|nr:hypothetical protein Bp8pS_251 [Bacillus phage vB_BpuM-BpSp]
MNKIFRIINESDIFIIKGYYDYSGQLFLKQAFNPNDNKKFKTYDDAKNFILSNFIDYDYLYKEENNEIIVYKEEVEKLEEKELEV